MASKRRLTASVATILVLTGAAGLSWLGADAAATYLEDRSSREVTQALRAAGHDWVRVRSDGLRVELSGTAPTEVERFRALTQAGMAVDAGRVSDAMTVASVEAMTPPDFKLELLRNDQGLSLIGLMPAATDRAGLMRDLGAQGDDVTDLLESADHPVPAGWADALALGAQAARMAAQAKVSVAPGRVQVAALAADDADKARLETELRRLTPAGVALDLQVSAPRPVVAPFVLRLVLDEGGARFDACTADDDAARERIAEAAARLGVAGAAPCMLGLGAPDADWGMAAEAAILALGQLGAGQLTLSDHQVAITAPATVARAEFDRAVAGLDAALPGAYQLQADLDRPETDPEPIEFTATLPPSGSLSMRGQIADAQMRQAVDSFARSRFNVSRSGLRSDPDVPGGWTVRVIAALEAMGTLDAGQVRVTPDAVELGGVSGDPQATENAAGILAERLGPGARYRLSITYDRRLDEALGLPDGDECVAQLNLVMSESEIGFEPNRSSIAGDPEPTLAQLAPIMQDCADFQIEAGGHTDSQGSQGFNAELSRSRAQAIVSAMQGAGIDVTNMAVRGYGESQPIATNETEEGREANRRIEFRLLSPQPVRADSLPAPRVVNGVTGQTPIEAPAPTDNAQGPQLPAAAGPMLPPVQGPEWPGIAAGPAQPRMQGPVLPSSREQAGTVPLTVGVAEEFRSLAEREETMIVPVLTPDDQTPRPGPRPDSVRARTGTTDEAPDE